VAQPSLSQQVKALETDLGALLVHRTRGKVGLIAVGETLLHRFRQRQGLLFVPANEDH
jgi:DNA-binding transcriptional LysR family regulator